MTTNLYKMKKNLQILTKSDSEEEEMFEKRALSPRTRMSITGIRPKDMMTDDESDFYEEASVQKNKSILTPGTSSDFNASIVNKPSSTMIISKVDENNEKSGVICTSSPIVRLEPPVTLLPVKGSTNETKNKQKSTTESANGVKYVSQEFYDAELKKLNNLKAELSTCDKDLRMSRRVERLKQEIKELSIYISTLKVDDSVSKKSQTDIEPPPSKLKTPTRDELTEGANSVQPTHTSKRGMANFKDIEPQPSKLKTLTWYELTEAANSIQPTHTGKVGMANFNAQKILMLDRLKDIHGSLDTCPVENMQAEDPMHLKADLMPHQRHALAWMHWREQQKPPGGILADDMGSGKTLTMLSLILACNQREEDEEEEEKPISHVQEQNKDYYGGTLIVCPPGDIQQWECEAEKRVECGKISVCAYHSNQRDDLARTLATYDIVLAPYRLMAEDKKMNGPLFSIKWKRVVLDEAHCIRNHKSQASQVVCKLRGRRRWALTGTPIHNKEMDMFALLRFLECSPFDELCYWKRFIESKSAGGQQIFNTLRKYLMLRRTKQQLQDSGSLTLPEKSLVMVDVFLDKDEMDVHKKLIIYARTVFAQFLQQRAEKHNDFVCGAPTDRKADVKFHEILVILLRLRQVCCHPGLIDSMLIDDGDLSSHNDDRDPNTCQEIDLLEQMNNLNEANDGAGTSESQKTSKDKAISKASSKIFCKSNPVFDLKRPSSKMKKIIETLEEKVLKTKDKALIVSQWTSVLDILKGHLEKIGITTLLLNRYMAVKFRNDIVYNFNNGSSSVKIMLLSLTAGGLGLNLIGANHLFLIDLHWNPQLEAHAQNLIYRLGQNKQVHIYKFICKNTIEETIKSLQDKKLALAERVLTGVKSTEGSNLSIGDLKTLFGL